MAVHDHVSLGIVAAMVTMAIGGNEDPAVGPAMLFVPALGAGAPMIVDPIVWARRGRAMLLDKANIHFVQVMHERGLRWSWAWGWH